MHIQMKKHNRARYERVPSIRAPHGIKVCGLFTNLEVPSILHYWDFMWASSHTHRQLLTLFLALVPYREKSGQAWKFQVSFNSLAFLMTSSQSKPSKSPPTVLMEQKILISLEILRNLGVLCQKLGSDTKC